MSNELQTTRRGIEVGDVVRVASNDYGYFKVRRLLPIGAHGKKCKLAEVEHSADRSFKTGLIKVFKVSDLRREATCPKQ
jgi:hypothetical protein